MRHGITTLDDAGGSALFEPDRLDVVAVRIEQERRVVIRAVVGAQAGTAVVASTRFQPFRMKSIDLRATGCPQRHMRAGSLFTRRRVKPQRWCTAWAEACIGFVVRSQLMTERTLRRGVETHTGVELAHLQTDVIVHKDLQRTCEVDARQRWRGDLGESCDRADRRCARPAGSRAARHRPRDGRCARSSTGRQSRHRVRYR